MTMDGRFAAVAFGAFVLVATIGNGAEAQLSKCTGAKTKAAGKKAAAKTACLAKALGKGVGTDSTCLAKAEVKFSTTVAKAEAKDPGECLTTGDASTIEGKVDALLDDIDALVDDAPPNVSACDAAKVKAAGKKAGAKLDCHAKATTKGLTADSTCLAKAEVKFSSAATKAEAKATSKGLPCTATGDHTDYEALIDAAVGDVVTEITPTTTTTTGPATTSTSATTQPPTTTTSTTIGSGTTTTSTTVMTTTSTTVPAQVTCGPNGIDVTARLNYEPRLTGGIFGMFMLVNYPTSVSIPGSGTASTARARFTELTQPPTSYGFVPSDIDTNSNAVDDQGRTLVTSNSGAPEIPPGPIERIRFDCATPGGTVQTSQFSCVVDQPSDSNGQQFPPDVRAQFSCTPSFAPA